MWSLLQARLDALEDGGGDDALAADDHDDEFDMDDELDVEVTGEHRHLYSLL